MNKPMRLSLLLAVLALLLIGGLMEHHPIASLSDDAVEQVSGPHFVSGVTTDDFTRRSDGRLYRVSTLNPGKAGEKDCKT